MWVITAAVVTTCSGAMPHAVSTPAIWALMVSAGKRSMSTGVLTSVERAGRRDTNPTFSRWTVAASTK